MAMVGAAIASSRAVAEVIAAAAVPRRHVAVMAEDRECAPVGRECAAAAVGRSAATEEHPTVEEHDPAQVTQRLPMAVAVVDMLAPQRMAAVVVDMPAAVVADTSNR